MKKGVLLPIDLIEKCRSRFSHMEECPFSGQWTFLDSASGALRLIKISEVVSWEVSLPYQMARPTKGSKYIGDIKMKGEQDVSLFLGAKSGRIVAGHTATGLIFQLIDFAVAHYHGNNIVTTLADHAATYDATWYAANRYGKELRVAPFELSSGVVTPEAILNLVDKDTSVLVFVHGGNITGSYQNAEKIIREARRINPEICVFVDGVQYASHALIDVEHMKADVYVIGPYKIFSKKGTAFAYVSDRFAEIPHYRMRGSASNDWGIGTVDQADYAAWTITVDYLCWLGSHFTTSKERREQLIAAMNAIEEHEQALLERLFFGTSNVDGLKNMKNIKLHCMDDISNRRACLAIFTMDNVDTKVALDLYLRQHVVVSARWRDKYSSHVLDALGVEDLIRVSACHYNKPEEIDDFLVATKSIVSK